MTPGDGEVFKQFVGVHERLGADGARLDALERADRDMRLEVERVGSRLDASLGALRAELKGDIDRMQAANEKATQAILAEIRAVALARAQESLQPPQRRSQASEFVAQHWKALGLAMAAVGFMLFGAGMKAGNHGATPQTLIESVTQ